MIAGAIFFAIVGVVGAALGWALLQRRAHYLPWPRPRLYRAVFVGQSLFFAWSLLKLALLVLLPTLSPNSCLSIMDGTLSVLGVSCIILIAGGSGFPAAPQGFIWPQPVAWLRRPGWERPAGRRTRKPNGSAPPPGRPQSAGRLSQNRPPWSGPGPRGRTRRSNRR